MRKKVIYGIGSFLCILSIVTVIVGGILKINSLSYLGVGLLLFAFIMISVNATSGQLSNAARIRQTAYFRSRGYDHLAEDQEQRMDESPEGAYRGVDTSTIHRVIVDPATKEEIVVHGRDDTTFREAVRKYWGFSQIDRGSRWIITDSRGNDITESGLSLYDGIATIREMDQAPPEREEARETDFSTLDSSVEYYD
ncbi:MAG: hypothetical protein ACTSYL_07440 [Candidatus Thorarchaeota archaeon]